MIEGPELFVDLIPVWNAFLALHEARIVTTSGVEPIKFSEILAWLTMMSLTSETCKEWTSYIRAMDKAYLGYLKDAKS